MAKKTKKKKRIESITIKNCNFENKIDVNFDENATKTLLNVSEALLNITNLYTNQKLVNVEQKSNVDINNSDNKILPAS